MDLDWRRLLSVLLHLSREISSILTAISRSTCRNPCGTPLDSTSEEEDGMADDAVCSTLAVDEFLLYVSPLKTIL